MESSQRALLFIAVFCLVSALFRIFSSDDKPDYTDYINKSAASSDHLRKMKAAATKEFKSGVIRVTPEVMVAIGYALANVILIKGPESCAIVDVTESIEAARNARNALEEELGGPCKVTEIVYTHNHGDHVYGAEVFKEWSPNNETLKIWAHRDLPGLMDHHGVMAATVTFIRAMRQFGALLPTSDSSGIGQRLQYNQGFKTGYLPPTHFLDSDSMSIELAGLSARLIHIPGETDDQIAVFLPESRTLLCADDLYKAFPNLYAIRGTPFRSQMAWLHSLERMMALNPAHLVPSHTLPISGVAEIESTLRVYRDAVQFVHDQTVRHINRDLPPDEIVHRIGSELPKGLRDHPYLQPLYGTLAWSARGLYAGYIGWFSGKPEHLDPLLPSERARRLVVLAGGHDKVLTAADEALANGDFQWALELATAVKALPVDRKALDKATDVRIKALIRLAHRQTSANGHNYLMTCAFEDMGVIDTKPNKKFRNIIIQQMPIERLFKSMGIRFRTEACSEVEKTIHFRFDDSGKTIEMQLRNGVSIVRMKPEVAKPDVEVRTREAVWREIVTGERSAMVALAVSGELKVKPEASALRDVMECFDRD